MSGENATSISATFSPRSEADMAIDDLMVSGFDKKEISLKRHVSSAVVTVSGNDPARLSNAAAILQRHGGEVEIPAENQATHHAAPRHPAVEKPGGGLFTPGSSAGGGGAGTAGGGSIFGN